MARSSTFITMQIENGCKTIQSLKRRGVSTALFELFKQGPKIIQASLDQYKNRVIQGSLDNQKNKKETSSMLLVFIYVQPIHTCLFIVG